MAIAGSLVAFVTFAIAGAGAGVGGGGPHPRGAAITLLTIGVVALIGAAVVERRHYWVTLIPFALVLFAAFFFLDPAGIFRAIR
jgi:hypothetical protein